MTRVNGKHCSNLVIGTENGKNFFQSATFWTLFSSKSNAHGWTHSSLNNFCKEWPIFQISKL